VPAYIKYYFDWFWEDWEIIWWKVLEK
jgi:hypothetical protein